MTRAEKRKSLERSEKQQAKGSSMDDILGGKGANADSRSAGISQANMAAMISADTSLKQAKVQGNVASAFEGRAGVLEIEIKLDEVRATGGKTANTEGKKAELAEVEQKAMDVTKAQAETLGEANKALEEAKKADEQAADKDTKASDAEEEKAKDKRYNALISGKTFQLDKFQPGQTVTIGGKDYVLNEHKGIDIEYGSEVY